MSPLMGGTRPARFLRSRDSRIFTARSRRPNGFWMKFTSLSSTPRLAMTSALYPDMKRHLGFALGSLAASSGPVISGMITSVSNRSIARGRSSATRSASPGVPAASTVQPSRVSTTSHRVLIFGSSSTTSAVPEPPGTPGAAAGASDGCDGCDGCHIDDGSRVGIQLPFGAVSVSGFRNSED